MAPWDETSHWGGQPKRTGPQRSVQRHLMGLSLLCATQKLCASFSNSSEHKYASPTVSSGITSQGATILISNAEGTKINWLIKEPLQQRPHHRYPRSAFTLLVTGRLALNHAPIRQRFF
jgi:hypothetical protein